MLAALRGLTTRGRAFLAAAAAAAVSAVLLGEHDLLRVAALLTVLPLAAVWYVGRSRHRLACLRRLTPAQVPVGGRAHVTLQVQNLSRLVTGTLLLSDTLPYALGSRPRLVLERLRGGQTSAVTYAVRAEVRGRYEIGPLVVRLTDPFGLCELTRSFPGVDRLTVVPEVEPLPAIRLASEFTSSGESRARSVAVHGEDDAATREYRRGDDLRRVHWRSTARAGELMVRREEQPWESRATVVLDTRASGHRGDGPRSSFETAVSAAASMVVHLQQGGYRVRLLTDDRMAEANENVGHQLVLDHLADVRAHRRAHAATLADQVRTHGAGGVLLGVFGTMSVPEAEMLAGIRGGGVTCVAFLVDAPSWLRLSDQARGQADRDRDAVVAVLLAAGWRVVTVAHGDALATRWPAAARGSPGFAVRAAMAETVAGGAR